jgi:transposase
MRLEAGERMVDLCREFEISRKSGYKLWDRYKEQGPSALFDQSRRPKRSPNRIAKEIEERIIDVRKAHATWGAEKLREWLLVNKPEIPWPSKNSFSRVLSRSGLAKGRPHRSWYSGTRWKCSASSRLRRIRRSSSPTGRARSWCPRYPRRSDAERTTCRSPCGESGQNTARERCTSSSARVERSR